MTADPRGELAWLARQVLAHAELDELLGVPASPGPPGPRPGRAPTAGAPPGPAAGARPGPASPRAAPGSPIQGPAPTAPPRVAPTPGVAAAPTSAPPGPVLVPASCRTPDELARHRAESERALEALARELTGCTRCRLCEGRTRLVFGQGDAAAELVFVGEGPGQTEDQQGLAFVGAAGELLTKMIGAMGLRREDVFICNVVKCRPPGNRTPAADEMATCLPFLERQLAAIRPRAICALGKTAALGLGLLGPGDGLGRKRGKLWAWRGIPTVITYHPAYLLRNPADKRLVWEDLQRLFPLLERRAPAP